MPTVAVTEEGAGDFVCISPYHSRKPYSWNEEKKPPALDTNLIPTTE
jgi:hypothetical protein